MDVTCIVALRITQVKSGKKLAFIYQLIVIFFNCRFFFTTISYSVLFSPSPLQPELPPLPHYDSLRVIKQLSYRGVKTCRNQLMSNSSCSDITWMIYPGQCKIIITFPQIFLPLQAVHIRFFSVNVVKAKTKMRMMETANAELKQYTSCSLILLSLAHRGKRKKHFSFLSTIFGSHIFLMTI